MQLGVVAANLLGKRDFTELQEVGLVFLVVEGHKGISCQVVFHGFLGVVYCVALNALFEILVELADDVLHFGCREIDADLVLALLLDVVLDCLIFECDAFLVLLKFVAEADIIHFHLILVGLFYAVHLEYHVFDVALEVEFIVVLLRVDVCREVPEENRVFADLRVFQIVLNEQLSLVFSEELDKNYDHPNAEQVEILLHLEQVLLRNLIAEGGSREPGTVAERGGIDYVILAVFPVPEIRQKIVQP